VGQGGSSSVIECDASTGTVLNSSFITGINQLAGMVLSGNILYVESYGSGTVGEYDSTTGNAINANFITGLSTPQSLALSSGVLYILSYPAAGSHRRSPGSQKRLMPDLPQARQSSSFP